MSDEISSPEAEQTYAESKEPQEPPRSQTDEQRYGKPNQPLPTEEEHHQSKVEKAKESGDVGSDIQISAKAAADQLAVLVAPTPAIPARPETATPPVNVAQRQRANLQPLPTDEELEELEVDAESLVNIAKKFFFIADDAGEPQVDTGTYAVFIHYPDGSMISVRFEYRPGDMKPGVEHAVGVAAVTRDEAQSRNKKFSEAKKEREKAREEARERAKQESQNDASARSESKQPVPVPVPAG